MPDFAPPADHLQPPEAWHLEWAAAGLQAPSAENRHFVEFTAWPDGLGVEALPPPGSEGLPHQAWLQQVAFGALLENLELHAAVRGAACRTVPQRSAPLGPSAPESWRSVRLQHDSTWAAAGASAHAATIDPAVTRRAGAIAARCTNRRLYDDTPVAPALQSVLGAAAEELPGIRLQWLDGAARRAAVAAATRAEAERFARRGLHQELFSAVRFDKGWSDTADEGLAPSVLEIEAPARPIFRALAQWSRMRWVAPLGVAAALGRRAGGLPCRRAPALALLSSSPGLAAEAAGLATGRALQRLWLEATAAGLAVQPMAAIGALWRQVPSPEWVSAATLATLRAQFQPLLDGRQPQLLVRLGHAAPPTQHTLRPPPRRFFTSPSHRARSNEEI